MGHSRFRQYVNSPQLGVAEHAAWQPGTSGTLLSWPMSPKHRVAFNRVQLLLNAAKSTAAKTRSIARMNKRAPRLRQRAVGQELAA